jgi:hypothetical protein
MQTTTYRAEGLCPIIVAAGESHSDAWATVTNAASVKAGNRAFVAACFAVEGRAAALGIELPS